MSSYPWQETPGGLVVVVRVTPKGGRDGIDGVEERADRPVLKVRVRAAPSAGAANTALIKLLAHVIGIAPSRLSLVSGAAGRIKRVRIEGKPAALVNALTRAAKRG